MAFDKNRPIPWNYLLKLLAIYLVISNIAFAFMSKEGWNIGLALSTLIGGAIYVGFSILLVKFGWDPSQSRARQAAAAAERRRIRDEAKAEKLAAKGGGTVNRSKTKGQPPSVKPKVAPTSRTNAGNRKAR